MKIKKPYIILILIFVLTLSTRLYFAFQTDYFDKEAYSIIRDVNHISENITPLFNDELSFGGRSLTFPPYYYYILFFFSTGLGDLTFKLIPNIFASLLVFVVYLLSYHITKDENASLFTSFISAFIPVFFAETVNNISVYTLIVPLTFLNFFFLLKISEKKKFAYYFILCLAFLRLSHPSAVLLIVGLLFYLVIIKLEKLRHLREELEIILFSTLIILWSMFVVFKKPLLTHGPYFIWQNIPRQILYQYFTEFNILQAVYLVGIIPFIFGVYIIYNYTLRKKDKKMYLFIAFAISMLLLLWLNLVQLKIGLIFLSVTLTILFAKFYSKFFSYLTRTKFSKLKYPILALLFILIISTSVIPSIYSADKQIKDSVTQSEIKALEWIKENTEEYSTVLATVDEGYLITTVAQRKNVADLNFLLIEDAEQRVTDIEKMYVTVFETEAVRLINKYSITYIYFSGRAKQKYNIKELKYIDSKCFDLIYDDNVKIYKSLCFI